MFVYDFIFLRDSTRVHVSEVHTYRSHTNVYEPYPSHQFVTTIFVTITVSFLSLQIHTRLRAMPVDRRPSTRSEVMQVLLSLLLIFAPAVGALTGGCTSLSTGVLQCQCWLTPEQLLGLDCNNMTMTSVPSSLPTNTAVL